MINLPEWKLTLCEPLYDTASKSPIEMTAQVYSKMRELVTAFNEFSVSMNKAFTDFREGTIRDIQEFEKEINCIMQNYIKSIDEKYNQLKIDIEVDLTNYIDKKITEEIISYNEANEEIVLGGTE